MLPAQADLFMIPVEAAATYAGQSWTRLGGKEVYFAATLLTRALRLKSMPLADYIDFWKERVCSLREQCAREVRILRTQALTAPPPFFAATKQASFDLSPLIPASKTSFLARPLHDWNMNDSGGVELGPRRRLFAFNMHTLAREDLEVLEASLDLAMHTSGQLHGLASWFDVGFAPAPVGKRFRAVTLKNRRALMCFSSRACLHTLCLGPT